MFVRDFGWACKLRGEGGIIVSLGVVEHTRKIVAE